MSDTIVTIPEETIKTGTVIHLPVEKLGDEVLYKAMSTQSVANR